MLARMQMNLITHTWLVGMYNHGTGLEEHQQLLCLQTNTQLPYDLGTLFVGRYPNFHLFERHRDKGRESESSVHYFTPQTLVIARARPSQRQKLKLGLPHWWQKSKDLSCWLLSSRVCSSWSHPGTPIWQAGISSSHTLVP